MNRRKFIASGAMGASLLSVFPSFALTANNTISLSEMGKGFKVLSNKGQLVSIFNLSEGIKNTHQRLMSSLKESGYTYESNSILKLNENCYMTPISKRSLFGGETKEIAFIIKEGFKSKFHVINESLSGEFNLLINNFNENMKHISMDIDACDFSFPVKVIKQANGVEDSFVYKNKFNNTITLYSKKSKSKAIIS